MIRCTVLQSHNILSLLHHLGNSIAMNWFLWKNRNTERKLPLFDFQPLNLKIHLNTSCCISISLSSKARKSRQHPHRLQKNTTSSNSFIFLDQTHHTRKTVSHSSFFLFHYIKTYMYIQSKLYNKEFMKLTAHCL